MKEIPPPNNKWTVLSAMLPIVIFQDENGEATQPYEIKNGKFVLLEYKPLTLWQKIKWFFKKKKALTEHRTWFEIPNKAYFFTGEPQDPNSWNATNKKKENYG